MTVGKDSLIILWSMIHTWKRAKFQEIFRVITGVQLFIILDRKRDYPYI